MNLDFIEKFRKEKELLFAELRQLNRKRRGVRDVLKKHTRWVDGLIASYSRERIGSTEGVCLVALGGYGRRQLNPHSDIDVMLLVKNTIDEEFIKGLYDLLYGLDYSCLLTTRTIEECVKLAKEDTTIKAALFDSRYVYGDKKLWKEYEKALKKRIVSEDVEEFVEAVLFYRSKRFEASGSTIFVLEPNIKEGVGSLRDYHCLLWIAKALYGARSMLDLKKRGTISAREYAHFRASLSFLWQLRNALHFITGKKTDILHLDLRKRVAEELGITDSSRFSATERLMRKYYYHAGYMERITTKYIELFTGKPSSGKPFRLDTNVSLRNGELVFDKLKDVYDVVQVFYYAALYGVKIDRKSMEQLEAFPASRIRSGRRDEPVAFLFREILSMDKPVAKTVRSMHESAFLDRFIPEFGNICCLSEYSLYHKYTVDEHSIQALYNLDMLYEIDAHEGFTLRLAYIWKHLAPHERFVLRLAVLLHDTGKIEKQSHEIVGARIAARVGRRLGIGIDLQRLLVFLVRNHLVINRIVSGRDVDDSRTLEYFVDVVKDKDRLNLLMLLAYSDMKAVNDNVWNSWKESLIESLYMRTAYYFENKSYEDYVAASARESRRRIKALLGEPYYGLIEQLPVNIFRDIETKSMARYIRDIKDTGRSVFLYKTGKDTDKLLVYYRNEFGLVHKISGVLVCFDINIVSARSYDLKSGMIIDIFDVRLPKDDINVEQIEQMLKGVDEGSVDLNACVDAKRSVFLTRTERARLELSLSEVDVAVDNSISDLYTVISIKAPDRIGLIYDITGVFTKFRLHIGMFIVDTKGATAVDTFYVVNEHFRKIYSEKVIDMIKSGLYEILSR